MDTHGITKIQYPHKGLFLHKFNENNSNIRTKYIKILKILKEKLLTAVVAHS